MHRLRSFFYARNLITKMTAKDAQIRARASMEAMNSFHQNLKRTHPLR
jgi:hypothetical protein